MRERPLDLVLDMGNSRTKAALFSGDRALRHAAFENGDVAQLEHFLGKEKPDRIAWGSVAAEDPRFMQHLQQRAPVLLITGSSSSPLRSHYGTPATLGVDRLANAVGASALFPGRAVIAVDLGTCITYDLVDAGANYLGGAISPGVHMRARAMHAYSARLPEVVPAGDPHPLGNNTIASLEAGIHHGVLGELKEFIRSYAYHAPDPAVVLTGGDAPRFARAMKTGIFAHPFLTLEGLRTILHHQLGDSGLPAGVVTS